MEINEQSTMNFECPQCGNKFEAAMIHHPGGVNDYGWWIIKCASCGEIFDLYVGRDVNDSSLTTGGEVLKLMDREVYKQEDVKETIKEILNEQTILEQELVNGIKNFQQTYQGLLHEHRPLHQKIIKQTATESEKMRCYALEAEMKEISSQEIEYKFELVKSHFGQEAFSKYKEWHNFPQLPGSKKDLKRIHTLEKELKGVKDHLLKLGIAK